MNGELKRFLNKINYENIDIFNGAKVLKVTVNSSKDTMTVHIENEVPIESEYIDKLFNCVSNGIDGVTKLVVKISYNNITDNDILNCFKYLFNKIIMTRPSLEGIKEEDITINNNIINIDVTSKLEVSNIKEEKEKLIKSLKHFGFDNILIEIKINEEKKNNLIKEIEITKEIPIIRNKKENTKKIDSNILYGREIKGNTTIINDIVDEMKDVIVEAFVFGIDTRENEKLDIITLKLSDKTNSLTAKFKIWKNNHEEYEKLKNNIKENNWYKIKGNIENDPFQKDIVLFIKDMESIDSKEEKVKDDEEEKRIELHAHTMYSQMDAVISPGKLLKQAKSFGHKAIAITDHNCLQAYPDLYNDYNSKGEDKVKVIYGAELNVINNELDIVINKKNYNLLTDTYVVFDTETTGFNAGGEDSLIEIGAVKICNGEVIDRFDELINPGRTLPKKIIELTGITDELLKDKDNEENSMKRFIEYIGDLPLVAHNAKFDFSFIDMAFKKYNLGEFKNTILDTMELSRILNPDIAKHSLSAIVKRYSIAFDEESHHRGDYDAEATATAFYKMSKILYDRNIETVDDLYENINSEDLVKFVRPYHVCVLAKNQLGLKNLFKIISLANTKYLYKTPKIPKSELANLREGLLIGSGCINGEVFSAAKSKTDEELANIMKFYDYIEVNPPTDAEWLIDTSDFGSKIEIINNVKKIIDVAISSGKIVVATGDVHNLTKEDKIYREIIINQKTPNVGFHPLYRPGVIKVPNMYYRTTKEMLDEFSFLNLELAKEIVITNTNKIAKEIEDIKIIKDKLYTPTMKNSAEDTKEMVYKKANEMYGNPLPALIQERLEKELNGIIGGGYDVIYLIAQKLVKKSNEDGYFVGSRGSVGSSLVATMMSITEVNPLPAHYLCSKCKKSIFELNGRAFNLDYKSGYDLPDKICECGTKMQKEGQDIPFSSFLGWDAEKVPDIDLNFSSENQADAHNYTKVLFGEDRVFRAGTIGTVADKTAYGFVKGYCEDNNINLRSIEIERLALGVTGVKRTTGQHPGGIIVIPEYMDVYDFTPFQYPADDSNNSWYTTHLDFHAIHDNVLKLDILGHDDPTILKALEDLSGIKVTSISFDDEKVLSLFNSPKVLKLKQQQINCATGTLGIPEFGTNFAIRMLEETKPKTFSDLVKISGLAHGTNVWNGNIRDLIVNKTASFDQVLGCREDLISDLIEYGIPGFDAFQITEFVRKNLGNKNQMKFPEKWEKYSTQMRENNVPEWYISSTKKIQYLFPKAHATAYVMMGYRVAWFKVYHPIIYYAAYFSKRCFNFDVESMIKGSDAIKRKIAEINLKGFDATNKEKDVVEVLNVALEMCERGFKFNNINLNISDGSNFIISEDEKSLYIPFRALDGLGDSASKKIIEEREKSPFLSIEDFQNRCRISTTTIDKLKSMDVFKDLPESNQLSLF